MRHITLTGYYAGKTVCGAPRNDNDTYAHIGAWLDNPEATMDLCPECAEIYNDSEDTNEA